MVIDMSKVNEETAVNALYMLLILVCLHIMAVLILDCGCSVCVIV